MSRQGGYNGGGERWDPERFTRERERAERSRGPPVIERDRFEEREFFEPRGGRGGGGRRRESSADEFFYDGGSARGGGRFEEKEKFAFEERFAPPARRPRRGPGRYYEEEIDPLEDSPDRGQMVPFESRRRPSIHAERGYGPPSRRGPARPTFIRRQSSLDTFDRKPMPRYGDRMREPPEVIAIPASSRRRRSPPRYVERDIEEVRVAEPDFYGDEEFRGYREREKSTVRRRRAGSEVEFKEKEIFRRAGSEVEFKEKEIFEIDEEEPEKEFPRRGKTKMPKRLVNKRAIIELGYPFEEEASLILALMGRRRLIKEQGETIIILKALGKEHIDEVINISREMNEKEETRTTYLIEAPPPPPEPQVIERRTEIIMTPPEPADIPRSVREWDVMSKVISRGELSPGAQPSRGREPSPSAKSSHTRRPSPTATAKSSHTRRPSPSATAKSSHTRRPSSPSVKSSHTRMPSPSAKSSRSRHRSRSSPSPEREIIERREIIEEDFGESNAMHSGPLALVMPERRKDERSIKAEIRALEAEKKALKLEREIEKEHRKADRYRERDTEIIIEKDRDVVKIEKDRKAPDSRLIKAMMATLT